MKKFLLCCCLSLGIAAAAVAQTTSLQSFTSKITDPAKMDWGPLITNDYVFPKGPVIDLSNIDRGSVIQIRSFDVTTTASLAPSLTWGPDEYNIRMSPSKGSRVVAAKVYNGGVAFILLAGDIPGNFLETIPMGSASITIKGRVTENIVKADNN